MARQIRTTDEIATVATDFETFILPFDASLDLDSRTTYGTTDPEVDLSMVNVRHLKDYTQFRGEWVETPRDGDDLMTTPNNPELPYVVGDVVFSADSNVVYRRTNTSLSDNPDPASSANTGHWVAMGLQVRAGNLQTDVSMNTAQTPGLVRDGSTLQFRGYTGGDGVTVNNLTGVITASNFSLTDISIQTTFNALRQVSTTEWHTGDIAIITGLASQDPDTDDGEGTYVYLGRSSGNNHTGTTMPDDWELLRVPHGVVQMVAGRSGPVITASQLVAAVNADTDAASTILTDDQAMRIGSRYFGTGAPATNLASATRQTGDVYVDTDENNYYFFDGDNWQQANPARLRDVGNVDIADTATIRNGQHIVWSDAANGGDGGWVVHDAGTATSVELNDLSNVTIENPVN